MKYLIVIIFVFVLLVNIASVFAVSDVSISVHTWDGSQPSAGLLFPMNPETLPADNPWIISPQYVRLTYTSDEPMWGIRIVTNNRPVFGIDTLYPKPINKGSDNKWEWENHPSWNNKYIYENGAWQTGNDSVSFGGLVDGVSKANPNFRASLAWQVFSDPVPAPDEIYKNWRGIWNVGGNWNDDWAYIVDKSDKWNGASSIGGIYSPPPAPEWSPKFEMIVTGDPYDSYLTQHPVVSGSQANPDIKLGDGDVAVYFAACFGISENGQFVGQLPAGDYTAALSVELIANE